MPTYQYLISKYHWKSKRNAINLSADSAFSFSGIGSKTKTWNQRKTFCIMFVTSYTSLTRSRGLIKLLQYTCLLHSFIMICFCFKKKKPLHLFFISKKQKLNEKNVKKILYCISTLILNVYTSVFNQ